MHFLSVLFDCLSIIYLSNQSILSSLSIYLTYLPTYLLPIYLFSMHAPWCRYGGQSTFCRNWLSLFTVWVLRIKLRLSDLVAETFCH